MEGKFRERAKTIWCPKPQPARIVTQEDVEFAHLLGGIKWGRLLAEPRNLRDGRI